MTFFQVIKQWFNQSTPPVVTSQIECPNCWGWQEYENQVFESSDQEKIDLHNIDQKKGWIVAYATKKFNGFRA